MSVQEIEDAIARLPRQELSELMIWLQKHHAQLGDEQIEDDLEAGRFDPLLAEVDAEYESGLSRPLSLNSVRQAGPSSASSVKGSGTGRSIRADR